MREWSVRWMGFWDVERTGRSSFWGDTNLGEWGESWCSQARIPPPKKTYFDVLPRNVAHKTSRTRIGLEARTVLAVLDNAVLEQYIGDVVI